MSDSLVVLLDDTTAGTLTRLRGGQLRFDYEDHYRVRPGLTPLSVSMPTQIRSHSDHVITPWSWNLLPDNDAVLARWARQFQVSASSPFSLLATPIGLDCAGAVRFVPPELVEQEINRPGDVTWLTDNEVAERLRELKTDSTAWLGRLFTGQFSLAGAQAKTALLYRDGRWGVPHGSTATTHILKPAVAGFDDHDLNEHLCLDAARRAGLIAARTHVARFGDETAIVVDRYDRRLVGDRMIRVHQEDLCQALGIPPSRKYQNEGGPGPIQIVELFRRVMSPRNADIAVARFFDALVWNWLIGGTDAHAKNYSLLLSGGQVRLAPLYDIASTLPYGTHERRLKLAMKIGGDYRIFPFHNTWGRAAAEMGIDTDFAFDRVRKLTGRVAEAFAEAAADPDVVALGRDIPGRLVDIIADRAARCRQLIDLDRDSRAPSTSSLGS
jgi:serine/threonine-protein kinase HipA